MKKIIKWILTSGLAETVLREIFEKKIEKFKQFLKIKIMQSNYPDKGIFINFINGIDIFEFLNKK